MADPRLSQGEQPEILWRPQANGIAPMDAYREHVNRKFNLSCKTTVDLHKWSCRQPQDFWMDLYSYLKLVPALPAHVKYAYDESRPMSSIPQFFPGLKLNYAENALFSNPDENATALIGIREGQDLTREDGEYVSWRDFRERVRKTASALKRCGIKKGDRVAALVSNSVWAMVLFHAAASIGAIFTSISPDLGLEGCVSRLQQVTPAILFADSATTYRGRSKSTISKIESILSRLSPQPNIYLIALSSNTLPTEANTSFTSSDTFLSNYSRESDALTFERVPFDYPLVICYSSGTTGAPKCIVHQHGLLIQLKKISTLHNSITPKDVLLQYSSTSWVVFYIMAGHFSTGATCIVYDGSPMYPDVRQLVRILAKYRCTYFGTSPRYLLELSLAQCIPKQEFDLSSLRMVYTTGATLSSDQYRWFYSSFPPRVHLCNTAGGTDTATSLVAADPCAPIHVGEMQVAGLGMDIDILNPETGASIAHTGAPGELVVRKPFPSMPPFFWGDGDGETSQTIGPAYREAYFTRFTSAGLDVWAQHDWLQRNPSTGGYMMSGRSDGVLNPSGIRFGSGEIYAVVEAPPFTALVSNTLCVGRRRPKDTDEQVFLFVQPKQGRSVTPALKKEMREAIKTNLSARHVPKYIIEVDDIPTTVNGKKVEVAVKQLLSGKDIKPSATVANPSCLLAFNRFRDVEKEQDADELAVKAKL